MAGFGDSCFKGGFIRQLRRAVQAIDAHFRQLHHGTVDSRYFCIRGAPGYVDAHVAPYGIAVQIDHIRTIGRRGCTGHLFDRIPCLSIAGNLDSKILGEVITIGGGTGKEHDSLDAAGFAQVGHGPGRIGFIIGAAVRSCLLWIGGPSRIGVGIGEPFLLPVMLIVGILGIMGGCFHRRIVREPAQSPWNIGGDIHTAGFGGDLLRRGDRTVVMIDLHFGQAQPLGVGACEAYAQIAGCRFAKAPSRGYIIPLDIVGHLGDGRPAFLVIRGFQDKACGHLAAIYAGDFRGIEVDTVEGGGRTEIKGDGGVNVIGAPSSGGGGRGSLPVD